MFVCVGKEVMELVGFEKLLGINGLCDLDELLCDKVVCGNKVMCFRDSVGERVVKEMRKSFNEGRDCMVLDEVKDVFGVRKMGMYRVLSDKSVVRRDKGNKYWEGNMEYVGGRFVYLVMNRFDNVGSLSRNKEFLESRSVRMEYLKILLYRGIFRVSDSNKTNVLVNCRGELMSIDENNIGKRDCILDRKYKFNFGEYSLEEYGEVLEDLMCNMEDKICVIEDVMYKYGFSRKMVEGVVCNFRNLEVDVMKDLVRGGVCVNKDKGVGVNKDKGVGVNKEGVGVGVCVNKEGVGVCVNKDMRRVGVFSGVTYNGYKVDVMKSCLQKYLRRNMFDKGVYCLWELDLFKGMDKGVRSNLRNRLLVMLGEDVDLDWRMWLKMGVWFRKWEEYREGSEDMDRVYLMNIYGDMCESRKSRMCSFLRGTFGKGCDMEGIRYKYASLYEGMEEYEEGRGKKYYRDGDGDMLKKYLDGFVGMLDRCDDRVFYWFFRIWSYVGSVGRRNRKSKVQFVLLDVMKKKICMTLDERKMDMYVKLIKLYGVVEGWVIHNNNSRNECWLWILGLVRYYMGRESIDWSGSVSKKKRYCMSDVEESMKRNLYGDGIEVDKYCVDVHCSDGRMKGMSGVDFWKEGGVVFNEGCVNELYKSVYGDIKMGVKKVQG